MKQFNYTITDPLGIHARPAGLLAKAAKTFPDTVIMIQKGDKEVKATQLMKLMGLGVKEGDVVTVTADGPSEENAIEVMYNTLAENL
ncbi:HPr family phosphocarrier protein [Anaerotignum sp.]|nr:HPr family phosphocarrier protein [Anaerotignum sp.]MBO5329159.1 HPr family phosphocarrier protein [Anaerotignum sp.]MBQ2924970.1 HPr family phosphocarrier protein [Anaerotignum sp.]MBQ7103670.1 HPr family phosphocarrier protein [Anaerotignum sp.]